MPPERPRHHADVPGENINIPFVYNGRVTPGANLVVAYSVDSGAEVRRPLAGSPPSCTLDVPENAGVKFRVVEVLAGGRENVRTAAREFRAARNLRVAFPPAAAPAPPAGPHVPPPTPHAPPSPHAPRPAPAPGPVPPRAPHPGPGADAAIDATVGRIIDALRRNEMNAVNLEALFQQLDMELEGRVYNPLPLILRALNAKIGGMNDVPRDIRDHFRGRPPPRDADEFMDRMAEGSTRFQAKVYFKMKADPEAQKAFSIRKGPFDPRSPFKSRRLNNIFRAVCAEHDFGGRDGAARLAALFQNAAPAAPAVPATSPRLNKQRLRLLKGIVKRRGGVKPGFLSKIRPENLDRVLELAVQAGGIAAIVGGSAGLGAGILLAKPVFEAFFGVKGRDFIKALQNPNMRHGVKELWQTFSQNFAVADFFRSEKTAGDMLKERGEYLLKRSVPLVSPLALYDEESVGGYEKEGEVVETGADKAKNLADIVRRACRSVMAGEAPRPASTPASPDAAAPTEEQP